MSGRPEQPHLRPAAEIQRAHDLFIAIVTGEIPCPFAGQPKDLMIAALDVLCWVLQHDHNPHMENNLRTLEQGLREMGIAAVDLGKLHYPMEERKP